jgi:putative transposase
MITEIIVDRPLYLETMVNLCLDKGYKSRDSEELIYENFMRAHIPQKGLTEVIKDPKKKPRRWTIERTFGWFNRYRRLLIRWEKKPENYLAFIHIACCVIVLSKLILG